MGNGVSETTERAKAVAALLSDNGLPVTPPDEATLDDVELERWKMCIQVAELVTAELDARRKQIGLLANCLSHIREGNVAPEPIKIAATAALVGAEQIYKDFANG